MHHHAPATSERYEYDPADRLVEFERGELNEGGSAITGTAAEAQRWQLDALGNWEDFEKDLSGTNVLNQGRTHRIDNALLTMGGTSLTYDPPGNLKDDGTYLYDYDCENRLTRVRTATTQPALIAEYGYNALGWRVKKEVSNSGALNGTFRLLYNSAWQLLEIRSVSGGSTTVAKQFIHAGPGTSVAPWLRGSVASPYIDDHIAMLTTNGGGSTANYYHTDGLFNTLAMTDASASVAERAQFEPYGSASLTDSGGDPLTMTAIGNPFERQGISRDWETKNDENRHRSYGPLIGRWAQRDPFFSHGAISDTVTSGASPAFEVVSTGGSATSNAAAPDFRPVTCKVNVSPTDYGEMPPLGLMAGSGWRIDSKDSGRPRLRNFITIGREIGVRSNQVPQSASALWRFMEDSPTRYFDPSGLVCIPRGPCTTCTLLEYCNGVQPDGLRHCTTTSDSCWGTAGGTWTYPASTFPTMPASNPIWVTTITDFCAPCYCCTCVATPPWLTCWTAASCVFVDKQATLVP